MSSITQMVQSIEESIKKIQVFRTTFKNLSHYNFQWIIMLPPSL